MRPGSAIRAGAAWFPSVVLILMSAGAIAAYVTFRDPGLRPGLQRWVDIGFVVRALAPIPFAVVGSIIMLGRPRNRVSLVLSSAAVLWAMSTLASAYAALTEGASWLLVGRRFIRLGGADLAMWIGAWADSVALGIVTVGLFLLFPDGRLPSRRWRPLAALAGTSVALIAVRSAFGPQSRPQLWRFEVDALDVLGLQVDVLGRRLELLTAVWVVGIAMGAVCVAARYRHADEDGRQQLKWFVLAAATVALVHVAPPALHFAGQLTTTARIVLGIGLEVVPILIPLAVGVAVFKYRLYDIDVVLHRTVLFGVMSLFITLAYVAVTATIGTAIAATGPASALPSVLALSPVAMGLAPLRSRSQRLADRVVYGARAEPYDVLATFARSLPRAQPGEEVLPRIAAAVGSGIGAEQVRVVLYLPDGSTRSASWASATTGESAEARPPDLVETIALQGDRIGELQVVKPRGRGPSREDRRLVRLLASSGAAALHNVRLLLDLHARREELAATARAIDESRRRLVTAHLDARRGLEDDVRRQVAPRLFPILELLGTAREARPDAAVALLDEAAAANARALDTLRGLAHGVYSPLVDELGVAAALESHLRDRAGTALRIAADARALRFDPVAEAAVYSCAVDVMRRATSSLELHLRVVDDVFELRCWSVSFDPMVELGRDVVQHVADRIEAVGGTLEVLYTPDAAGAVRCRVPLGGDE